MSTAGEKPRGAGRIVFFLLSCALLGALGGQLLGSWLVAMSNYQLLFEQMAIAQLGCLAVPGKFLASEMTALPTCLAGGIFFALSLGLGYGFFCGIFVWNPVVVFLFLLLFRVVFYFIPFPLLSMPSISLADLTFAVLFIFTLYISSLYKGKWYRYVRLWPVILIDILVAWQGKGSAPVVFFSLLLFPLLIYFLSFPLLSRASLRPAELARYGFLFLTFAVLLVVTFRQLDFIEIRDRLLLPTKAGSQIDEFYYRYTLYPARLVQPLCYRLQNVVVLDAEGFREDQLSELRTILRRHDWFAAASDPGGDFQAAIAHADTNEDEILFYWRAKGSKEDGSRVNLEPTYRVSYREFIQNPSEHLEKYSLAADPFALLSKVCGISLFIIIPLALAFGLFVLCIFLIKKVLSLFRIRGGRIKETGLILGIILTLFLALNLRLKAKSQIPADRQKLWPLAKGEEPGDRIGALKRLDETLEPQSFQAHQEDIILLTRDRDPVVRRFAAQLLGKVAGHDEINTFPLLLSLLEDSNINVVYTAAESVGEIHNQRARDVLLGILESNKPWYLKMKVYHALKDVGWINEPKVREPKVGEPKVR